jgi:hypothetical protein
MSLRDFAAVAEGPGMTALVLVFCLQSAPGQCIEERPVADLDPRACMMQAQNYAVNWLVDHPKWRLSRWRCEKNVPRQQPA